MAKKTRRSADARPLAEGGTLEGPSREPARTPNVAAREQGKWLGMFPRIRARPELRFVVTFAVIAGTLFSVYSFPYPDGRRVRLWSDSYLQAYAHLAGWVLSMFEKGVAVSGQDIIGHYSLRIVRGCDAVDAQILFASAVLASSTHSWRWRLVGAAGGFLLITAANVVRICSLYYVGANFPAYFDFFHHEFWPLLLIVLAVAAFIQWSRLAVARESSAYAT